VTGALVGLLPALAAAVVRSLVSIPIDLLAGPTERAMLQLFPGDMGTFPPRRAISWSRSPASGSMGGRLRHLSAVFGLMLWLFRRRRVLDAGGLLGAADLQGSRRRQLSSHSAGPIPAPIQPFLPLCPWCLWCLRGSA